ncbi:unnamed protein product [Didymodactylos carnosus]|uniref:Uncharacterized protein n=1 Tax=Didymodactylos carnosus TaxID=1234261 RepID=A0A815YWC1_9BILA|nr:unnamed protein product [Didymodactylos carnosus]CAF1576612.1 unnamed protein product [Didymodactylos carnosus]CAF4026435.1 unnamed protein product [Didymodactylos carnosus]CAF4441847.1 unnamed protein product [Didymodactylos carnosus]
MLCKNCSTNILSTDCSLKLNQESTTNFDDLNEVVYCHRFCEAHQHGDEAPVKHKSPEFNKNTAMENTEIIILSKDYVLVNTDNSNVNCQGCGTKIGSYDSVHDVVSIEKCLLKYFSDYYLLSCFRHYECGRYIIKVKRSNQLIFLLWILPNELLAARCQINKNEDAKDAKILKFNKMRKMMFMKINHDDMNSKLLNDWKHDFSVTTIHVSEQCLHEIGKAFEKEMKMFPHSGSENGQKLSFQSLTVAQTLDF